jgi:hypothetical protein
MNDKKIPARFEAPSNGEIIWATNIYALDEDELREEGFSVFDYEEDLEEEMKWASTMLTEAIESDLTVEVVIFALKAMQQNSSLSPAMALRFGYLEWIK